jgi:hypothetical protein
MRNRIVTVNDRMQRRYRYALTAPAGRNFDPEFRPALTPAQMLKLGVFCGKYLTDCAKEFPASWFKGAKLSPRGRNCALNFFGIRRWKAIRRHVRQVQKNCEPGDLTCRKRQRQALLHWAYDSRKI